MFIIYMFFVVEKAILIDFFQNKNKNKIFEKIIIIIICKYNKHKILKLGEFQKNNHND